ncbi:MAG: hypothetical protein HY912_10650 [Desulfomonile tiedjei]|uniref:Uncharacterized protein n=1 Tax=Desulfomonile tiedjei TaxID=2358 RepID=A0A9D6V4P8_9BACT|nr:hypothetical protein [Desulfomonile tiedjei]
MGISSGLTLIRMSEDSADLLKSVATIRCRRLTNTKYGNGAASFPDLLVWGTETWYALVLNEKGLLREVRGRIGAVLSLVRGRPFAATG